MKNPLISIVIPTFNRETLILETLETVFNQTYTHYEIIVVDNASTDNSIKILRGIAQEGKIRLIENQQNLERARARNVGFKAAEGDYLTLLDSDDFMYPNALQDAVNYLGTSSKNDFFHQFYELVDEHKIPLYQYRFPAEKKQIKKLAEGNFISCIGVFLSKKVYREFFFNEDEKILGSEDWELWIRVRSKYELGVIPRINFGIRSHTNRSISAYDLESIAARKDYIINGLLNDTSVAKVFGKFENLMRSSALVFTAVSANQAKQFNESKKFLKAALLLTPKLILNPRFLRVAQIANFKIDKSF
jgi:glycosyltransferase involved in cell wall biosynthesis